ncbi:MAG TPA: DUF87 domain-containing protein [Acidimicrobiales bacterium]|nr:DUF87 domain-containing protein [Acidimicrobiales bacterium]
MRVVLLGKGGSGKSTLAGLLCAEIVSRRGSVVAFDADTVPGLGEVLGMPATDDWFLAGTAVREGGGWRLDGTPADVVDRCARDAPGGVRFVQVGNADATLADFELYRARYPDRWSATMAFNTVCRVYDDEDGWVIVDLQGGTVNVAGGMAGTSGVALLVVEPFAKSVLTARRMAGMGPWPAGIRLAGVASKVASPADEAYVAEALEALGVPRWGSVPLDPAIRRAERAGEPLVSVDRESPARRAVAALVDRLEEAGAPAGAVRSA